MKHIHRIALLVIILISLGLMAWAVVAGMRAPESDKIASTMQLIGQYDENCEPIKDSLDKTLPVLTTDAGVLAINSATIYQVRNAEGLNYMQTVAEIRNIDPALEQSKAVYEDAKTRQDAINARLAEIEELKSNKKEYNKTKKERTDLDKEFKSNDSLIKVYEGGDYAARYSQDSTWQARIADIKGKDFASESALVIEYMQSKYDKYAADLQAKLDIEKNNAEVDAANLETLETIRKTFGVEEVKKLKNPEDEKAGDMPDYKATIANLKDAIAKKEKDTPKKEWNNTFKPVKEQFTDEFIAAIEAYDTLQTEIVVLENDVATTHDNIETVKKAVAEAKADGENLMALAKAVSFNIYWLYFLMLFAVVFVAVGFILNFIQNPNWIKIASTLVVVAIVVAIAYFMADSHGWNDGKVLYVLDANGISTGIVFGVGQVDSPDRYVFTSQEYMLTDITIWITYLSVILGLAAAVVSSVRGIFKK